MQPLIPARTRKSGPEAAIQQKLMERLKALNWFVMATHGNSFQSGFPDLFVCHARYGQRWIEVKNPLGYSFTAAQLECFPKMSANGVGIWILVGSHDEEIVKLNSPANWEYYYLKRYMRF